MREIVYTLIVNIPGGQDMAYEFEASFDNELQDVIECEWLGTDIIKFDAALYKKAQTV